MTIDLIDGTTVEIKPMTVGQLKRHRERMQEILEKSSAKVPEGEVAPTGDRIVEQVEFIHMLVQERYRDRKIDLDAFLESVDPGDLKDMWAILWGNRKKVLAPVSEESTQSSSS